MSSIATGAEEHLYELAGEGLSSQYCSLGRRKQTIVEGLFVLLTAIPGQSNDIVASSRADVQGHSTVGDEEQNVKNIFELAQCE